MLSNKLWVYKQPEEHEVDNLSKRAGISRLMAKVFISRGITDEAYIKKFLEPSLQDLYDPFLLKDMEKAVSRIITAVSGGEKIVIYGDYDVDGVTSTSVLYDFLNRNNANAGYYIPDRIDEGYGLSNDAVDRLKASGTNLIISVDCGITAFEEVKHINECGMEIIITDHHECKEALPEAYAVVNPCRPDCTYPFKELAGVGVVFKLVSALCTKMGLGSLDYNYLDLVTLGTVADVVPLVDENRIIVKHGIDRIVNTSNIGLKSLIEAAGIKDKPVNSFSISFMLAPRINAAGRVGDAGRAVKLFITEDEKEAAAIATELNEENKYRQDTESEILQQVLNIIESDAELVDDRVLVVSGEGWHHGVIGIVASKITEKYYRPSILISNENGTGKGSGRSIEGFNLFKALCNCEELLEKYGGHELAAGLSLNIENVAAFRKMINEYAHKVMTDDDLIPRVKVDAYIGKSEISIKNIMELEKLAPFGAGNPGPRFAYSMLKVADMRAVGDDKHLKLNLEDDGFSIDAIGFNMGHLAKTLDNNDSLDVVFSLEINSWNNTQKPQLNLKDIKLDKETASRNSYFYNLDKCIEFGSVNDYNIYNGIDSGDIVPDRQDLVAVYQFIKANSDGSMQIDSLFTFAKKIAISYRINMNYFKAKKCLEIFQELNLLKLSSCGEYGMIIVVEDNVKTKTNLENSQLYRKLQALKARFKEAK